MGDKLEISKGDIISHNPPCKIGVPWYEMKKLGLNKGDISYLYAQIKISRIGATLRDCKYVRYWNKEKQNKLRTKDIDKIIDTYKQRKEEERYSRPVSMDEIERNGYNLNISRYVSIAKEDVKIDLLQVNKKLIDLEGKIAVASERHNKFLAELGLPLLTKSKEGETKHWRSNHTQLSCIFCFGLLTSAHTSPQMPTHADRWRLGCF